MASEKESHKNVASVIGRVGLELAEHIETITEKEIDAYRTLVDWYCSRIRKDRPRPTPGEDDGG